MCVYSESYRLILMAIGVDGGLAYNGDPAPSVVPHGLLGSPLLRGDFLVD